LGRRYSILEYRIKTIGFGIGTFVSWVVGGLGIAFTALLGMMVLDFISGVLVAWRRGEASSSIGREGMTKKFFTIVLIGAIYLIELVGESSTGQQTPLLGYTADGASVAYMFVEFISLIENGIKLNVPIPEFIKKGIKVYNEQGGM
jgi:toxin secretion/phage lysis holin